MTEAFAAVLFRPRRSGISWNALGQRTEAIVTALSIRAARVMAWHWLAVGLVAWSFAAGLFVPSCREYGLALLPSVWMTEAFAASLFGRAVFGRGMSLWRPSVGRMTQLRSDQQCDQQRAEDVVKWEKDGSSDTTCRQGWLSMLGFNVQMLAAHKRGYAGLNSFALLSVLPGAATGELISAVQHWF